MNQPLTTKIFDKESGKEIEVFCNIQKYDPTLETYAIQIIDSGGKQYGWAKFTIFDAEERKKQMPSDSLHLYPELGVIEISDMGNNSSKRREKNKNVEENKNTGYKHVGYAIHEAVFRFSIKNKCHGMIMLSPAWEATAAHFKAGYRMLFNFWVKLDEKMDEKVFNLAEKYLSDQKVEDGLAFVFNDKFEEIISFTSQKKGFDSAASLEEIIRNGLYEKINDKMKRKCQEGSDNLQFPGTDSQKMYLPPDKILENIKKFKMQDEHKWEEWHDPNDDFSIKDDLKIKQAIETRKKFIKIKTDVKQLKEITYENMQHLLKEIAALSRKMDEIVSKEKKKEYLLWEYGQIGLLLQEKDPLQKKIFIYFLSSRLGLVEKQEENLNDILQETNNFNQIFDFFGSSQDVVNFVNEVFDSSKNKNSIAHNLFSRGNNLEGFFSFFRAFTWKGQPISRQGGDFVKAAKNRILHLMVNDEHSKPDERDHFFQPNSALTLFLKERRTWWKPWFVDGESERKRQQFISSDDFKSKHSKKK